MDITEFLNICTYYIISLHGELFALEVDCIREVRVGFQEDISPVSELTPLLTGFIQIGHEVVPVVNTKLAFGIQQVPEEEASQKQHTIVIIADDEQKNKCGLLVENCLSVTNFNRNETVKTDIFRPYIQEFFFLKTNEDKQVVKVLDVNAIFKEIKLTVPRLSYLHW